MNENVNSGVNVRYCSTPPFVATSAPLLVIVANAVSVLGTVPSRRASSATERQEVRARAA
jgi:hypothetical protein